MGRQTMVLRRTRVRQLRLTADRDAADPAWVHQLRRCFLPAKRALPTMPVGRRVMLEKKCNDRQVICGSPREAQVWKRTVRRRAVMEERRPCVVPGHDLRQARVYEASPSSVVASCYLLFNAIAFWSFHSAVRTVWSER